MGYDARIEPVAGRAIVALRAGPAGREAAAGALGLALPPVGGVSTAAGRTGIAVAPDEWLLVTRIEDEQALFDTVDGALGGVDGATAVVSDAYACLRVAGPEAGDVMAQAVALDLGPEAAPAGGAWRTGLGRASAVVHKLDAGACFEIYVDSTLERYARRLLARTAHAR